MVILIQALQALSGGFWLVLALYLSPRIVGSWRAGASRTVMLSAPIGFVAWLQVGFIVRWMAWPHALARMGGIELATWAALYGLSAFCALWVLAGAWRTRGQ